MAEPTLYLFDGYNLLHAGEFADRRELVDALASFVALRGARGIVVFDGIGDDEAKGSLEVRYAAHADALLERLASENRASERVCIVTSDAAIKGASGLEVTTVASRAFASQLRSVGHVEDEPSQVADRVDARTRERLERLRRNEK
jgi:predicted RNA-binding protein with PIN domain